MPRKRFNADEKAVIAQPSGTPVQVQNVTQWHDGTLVTGHHIITDNGWQHISVKITRTKGSLFAGDIFPASPGHIRRAQ